MAVAMRQPLDVFSQLERGMIRERMQNGVGEGASAQHA
jgi:DNA invertase Pin-like site-specific DNA recombinase